MLSVKLHNRSWLHPCWETAVFPCATSSGLCGAWYISQKISALQHQVIITYLPLLPTPRTHLYANLTWLTPPHNIMALMFSGEERKWKEADAPVWLVQCLLTKIPDFLMSRSDCISTLTTSGSRLTKLAVRFEFTFLWVKYQWVKQM